MSPRLRLTAGALLAVAVSLRPTAAAAQGYPAPVSQPVSQPYVQTAAINAIGLPFGLFSAEYEVSLAPGFTVGAGGSYLSTGGYGDVRGWAEGKVLYYPNEVAFDGLGVGLTLGFLSARKDDRSDTRATLGVMANYNWLLGAHRRFLVGTGVGARRVVGNIPDDSPVDRVYPDARAVIGIAF
ncbi:MAG: hypothetical protein ACJ79S_17550 [Gemmatimonadaceae bacterium]